jgi:hypothetical protein
MRTLQSRITKELKIQEEMKNLITSINPSSAKDRNWQPPNGSTTTKGVASQTRVGWFQIAYGRLAKEFVGSLAAMDESSNPKASAKMHGKKLIRSIWDAFLQLWKQRNKAVHGITEQTRKEAQVNAMEMKVRQCYAQQHIMPINDRQRLFQMPEDEKLSEDPRKL